MNMKTNQLMAVLAAGLLWAGTAAAQTQSTNFTFSSGQSIPDADANGLALTYNLSGMGGTISNVTVSLDISGGNNGDLYAYLAGPNGGFAVLLNRTGVNGGNAFGYADTGFSVTLDDTAANSIQYYQAFSPVFNGSGQLTGTWQPDGVNIDPQSDPSLFASTGQTALLNSFDGSNPNGTWTLFLADLVAGNQSVEGPVTVTVITAAPEPATLALAAAGGIALLLLRQARQRRL